MLKLFVDVADHYVESYCYDGHCLAPHVVIKAIVGTPGEGDDCEHSAYSSELPFGGLDLQPQEAAIATSAV